jgi:hypothetical protein
MLIEYINASMGKAPKEKETCYQDEGDHKSLVNKLLPVTIYRNAVIHIQLAFVNTRLS